MDYLEELAARQAICDGKARYCRCLDTKDWDGFANVFTDDFEMDVSDGTGLPVIHGRVEAVREVRSSIEDAVTAHQVHQPEMVFSGEEATVTWAMQDRVIWGPDKPSLVGYGHYHERWVHQDGQWKMASLKLTRLHIDFLPAAEPA